MPPVKVIGIIMHTFMVSYWKKSSQIFVKEYVDVFQDTASM